MIIHVPAVGDNDEVSARYNKSVFEHLVAAHSLGNHVFVPDLTVLEQLKAVHQVFSDRQRACIGEIEKNLSFYRGMMKKVKWYFVAVPDAKKSEFAQKYDQPVISYRELLDPDVTKEAWLLVENPEDADFYKTLVGILRPWANMLNLEDMPGGGSGIVSVYRRKLERCRPMLAIVDSDQWYPGAAFGENAKGIQQLRGKEPFKGIFSYILPVRMPENFLCCDVMEECFQGNQDCLRVIERYRKLEILDRKRPKSAEFLRFVDKKKGIRQRHLECISDKRGFDFMATLAASVGASIERGDDPIIEGVSDKQLKKFVERAEEPHFRKFAAKVLSISEFSDEIAEIVEEIVALGVSSGAKIL